MVDNTKRMIPRSGRRPKKAIIRKPVNIVIRLPPHVHDDLVSIKQACKSLGINVSIQNIMVALIVIGKVNAETQLSTMSHTMSFLSSLNSNRTSRKEKVYGGFS